MLSLKTLGAVLGPAGGHTATFSTATGTSGNRGAASRAGCC